MADKKPNNSISSPDHLNEEDRALWQLVSATAQPLKCRPDTPRRLRKPTPAKAHAPTFKNHKKPINTKVLTAPSFVPQVSNKPSAAPVPGVDKRMKRRLGRGQMDIDARLDLHGKTRAQAHGILKSFILNAQARGNRTVLVITGKGGESLARHTLHGHDIEHTPERKGILMREVPQWLHEPEFSSLIVGYQPAHPKHGGGGALYIRIRRMK